MLGKKMFVEEFYIFTFIDWSVDLFTWLICESIIDICVKSIEECYYNRRSAYGLLR